MDPSQAPQNSPVSKALPPLDAFFTPQNVAVVGATDRAGSVGSILLRNLIMNPFGGTVYPVNPKRNNVMGVRAYPRLRDLPEPVDLAVVATPAPTVPDVIDECAQAGVQGALVISAGFKESGPGGMLLEKRVLEAAQRGGLRLMGPNSLGVMVPYYGLNASLASDMARPGGVGFVTESGALCTAVLDWSLRANVGFSALVTAGAMVDVGWGDLIRYLGDDPRTKSIALYMESLGDAQSFLSAAREVALIKPIVVLKAGRSQAAVQAAASHTGALMGSDAVLDAVFRRAGVLRVESLEDLFRMAEVLSKQPRPKGPRLSIVTNAGGAGVLATDALLAQGGLLSELSQETQGSLDGFLPPHWSHGNPVDILGDAGPQRFANALEVLLQAPESDGALVVLTPQAQTEPTQTAEHLKKLSQKYDKPILAAWMGGAEVAAGKGILHQANIPTFTYPDTAARVFQYMWRHSDNLARLYETPSIPLDSEDAETRRSLVQSIVDISRKTRHYVLTEFESKKLVSAYGIPVVDTKIAKTEEEAVVMAHDMGYPVVLKLDSRLIHHKTDVGGVHLNLTDGDAVRLAYREICKTAQKKSNGEKFRGVTVQPMIRQEGVELILGSRQDPQFGPVLLFGMGGTLVEVVQDTALALPPLSPLLARRLISETRVAQILQKFRGQGPVDHERLEDVLMRFSLLSTENPLIKEIDINPLFVYKSGAWAMDARVVLHEREVEEEDIPAVAIPPAPADFARPWTLKDGRRVLIRPIRPQDESKIVAFHEAVAEESVYLYYYQAGQKTTGLSQRHRLSQICFSDFSQEMALVALHEDPRTRSKEIVGVARLSRIRGTRDARFVLLIEDNFQRRGLGHELLGRLFELAHHKKVDNLICEIHPGNRAMRKLCGHAGMRFIDLPEEGRLRAEISLKTRRKAS